MKETQEQQNIQLMKEADSSSVLQVRLDTSYIINGVKEFLTGIITTVMVKENGEAYIQTEKLTEPKANKKGIDYILNAVRNVVNAAVVQGNFDEHLYETYLYFLHDNLTTNLMSNLYYYDIREEDYEPIIDNIMSIMIPFTTRPLENKERESYVGYQVKEGLSNTVQTKSKIFG